MNKVTENIIVDSIKFALSKTNLITPNKIIVNSVYFVLKSYFIDGKKYVILEAPTGSGKSIIGFILHYAYDYIMLRINGESDENNDEEQGKSNIVSYYLTSSKMLQEQLNDDIDRFKFDKEITILKGTNSYPCDNGKKGYENLTYKTRFCLGVKDRNYAQYPCQSSCAYENARFEASRKDCVITNYHFFLNVLKSDFNPYFSRRSLTICDEAHLLPDIVANFANFELTPALLNKLTNFNGYYNHIDLKKLIDEAMIFFKYNLKNDANNQVIDKIIKYFDRMKDISSFLSQINTEGDNDYLRIKVHDLLEDIQSLRNRYDDLISLFDRPDDIYFNSFDVSKDGKFLFKHEIKDLCESQNVKKHFIEKCHKILFMSATLGNMDEYSELLGLEKDTYVKLKIPSVFNYDKSPIYICKSGWLNYKNFQSNIDNVLETVINICDKYKNEKGIIHTATFAINTRFKNMLEEKGISDRFLFYENADEKERCVNRIKYDNYPYVIVGPSLYEGLDLKHDQGRFNILIKVPYPELNDYVSRKMKRYPFWYDRTTKEKIVQSSGRTNRDVNDWSHVYLLDSCFDRIIWGINSDIDLRLKYLKI